jgi:hypothetical protein
VIVAAGKGEIAGLFARDASKSVFGVPQRAVALTYLHGLTPRPGHSAVDFNLIPGVGEYFVFPALTLSGVPHHDVGGHSGRADGRVQPSQCIVIGTTAPT